MAAAGEILLFLWRSNLPFRVLFSQVQQHEALVVGGRIKVQIPSDILPPCSTVRLRQRHLLDIIGLQFFKGIDLPQEIRCGNFPFEIPPSDLDRSPDPFLIASVAHRLQPIPLVWRSVLITVPPFFHPMPQSIVYPQRLIQCRTILALELWPQCLAGQSVDHTVAVVRFRRGFRNEILSAALTPCDTLFLLTEIKLQFHQVQLKGVSTVYRNRFPNGNGLHGKHWCINAGYASSNAPYRSHCAARS